ncbi:MAG TPA: ribosome assembly factor SBDS [Candidatus Diapherotrites archaeon]|uniref:Ribosome assembly factor SBDS n=1 Tax=Candidatus Iainarchaeum sp. TaxID=3101447 RepID=A0A7J4IYU7_9ARCH|nr:ribosome assembly factor SBDS [Candidatus Diapherotrites archaeon]
MVRTEDAVIARFEHSGEKFEILVDPHLAMDLKQGRAVDFGDLMLIDTIFKDANKGEEKSEESLRKVFGTTDKKAIATRIITEGEIQLTTAQRKEIAERKRREIVTFISRNAMNPQTGAPHPVQRIETALEEIRFSVDISRPVRDQINEAIKSLKRLLPISLDKLNIAVRIPAQFAGKVSVVLHKYDLKKEEWQNDGSLVALLEVPAGVKQDLFNELNHLTHGEVESKILDAKR